jgi:hypothetical protein
MIFSTTMTVETLHKKLEKIWGFALKIFSEQWPDFINSMILEITVQIVELKKGQDKKLVSIASPCLHPSPVSTPLSRFHSTHPLDVVGGKRGVVL